MKTFNGYTYFYEGKRLVRVTKINKIIRNTYDLEGLIIKKEVDINNTTTTTINYYYDNRKLVKEVCGNTTISYFYDENNQLYGYKENNTIYFYIWDVLGNIIGILNNSGVIVSKLDYDAFGNIINQTGSVISNFRYKGYYYDTDIELYYLKTRFYNPVLLRFITPDSIEYLDSSSIIGLNLYAYCGNDPVNMVDEEGNFGFLASVLIGAVIGLVISYASDVVSNAQDGFEWSDLNTFEDNWKKYVCATVGGAVSGAFGSFGKVGLSFVGGFVGNMIDNAYTFTNVESLGNSIITSVISGALSGLSTAVSNRLATTYFNRQLSKASSKTAHQLNVFLKNMAKKKPSPSTKAFAILKNTYKLRESARNVGDAIVTLLGIFY